MSDASGRADVDVDLRGVEDFTANPYPYYEKLRAAGPVHTVRTDEFDRIWLVVGYGEARAALADQRLGKEWRGLMDRPVENQPIFANMLELDAPHHTRLRKLITREFTARRVESLRPRVQQITDELLDAMVPAGRADLVDALAFPLPMTVICELIGVPDLDRRTFRRADERHRHPGHAAAGRRGSGRHGRLPHRTHRGQALLAR